MSPLGLRDLPFAKWQGCGNDYLFVDLRGSTKERIAAIEDLAPRLAPVWSHRRFGIGSDGLVLLLADPEADLRLAMWNADGSRGSICGTALRCATAMLADERGSYSAHLRLASDAGFHATRVERDLYGELRAAVEIGQPRFVAPDVPFDPDLAPAVTGGEDRPWRVRVPFGGREWDGAVLSVGNPHLIVRIEDDPRTFNLSSIGPPLESAECFPDRANVSLAHQTAESALVMQTYERGTGVTLSCGSAACAAVVAFTDAELLPPNREIEVRTPGGRLGVRWSSSGALWLSGPAREVFTGRAPLPG